jgi:hypothetical protein
VEGPDRKRLALTHVIIHPTSVDFFKRNLLGFINGFSQPNIAVYCILCHTHLLFDVAKITKTYAKTMHRLKNFYLCNYNKALLHDFNIDFRSEPPHIDEIGNSKQHMLKEIMKLADKMQVLCQYRIKTFIPIRRRTVHSNE